LPPRHRGSGPYKSSFEGRAQGSEEGQRSVWPEAPEDQAKRQVMRVIEYARSDLVKRVTISENCEELLKNLSQRTDEFSGRDEVQEIY
jgi:hypothetical protein